MTERNAPDDTPQRVWWRDGSGLHERGFALGSIKAAVLQLVPGEKNAGREAELRAEVEAARDA